MSKKFFSLISDKQIHIGPKTRIIPKEDIQELLAGKEVLDKIKEDAKAYRQEVAEQCEKLKEKATLEGYEEGFKSWLEHIARLEEEIVKVRKEFEKLLIPITLKAAKKIVGREIEVNDDIVVDIVSNALKPVATHKKIVVYVNKKDFQILDKNKPKLKSLFETLETFTLRVRDDITPGSCVIETEVGIINAQLENQWRTLEKAFNNLVQSKETRSAESPHESPEPSKGAQ
jgi:type III secretion protein L